MADAFTGEIRMGGWNFAPAGWAFCNGALMAISQNSALFTLLGTTYGGDGQNTFALPNLQGRLPVHQGSSFFGTYTIGQVAGTENVTLTTPQIPSHSHALEGSTWSAATTDPTGQTFAASNVDVYVAPTAVTAMNDPTTSAGGGQPHSNLMPYACITFVIALSAIFPSQN
jgi:microcystin-dependent protein